MIKLLLNKYTIGALAAIGIVFGIWLYGNHQYNKGYEISANESKLVMETLRADLLAQKNDEVNRQIAANQAAQENSQKRLRQIETEKQALERLLDENDNQAKDDPNSNDIGLNDAGVMRLNKIR